MKKIIIVLTFVLLLVGCGLTPEEDKTLYSEEDMLEYVNNLESIRGERVNLKGHYDIVSRSEDKLVLRIKNTNLEFEVWQTFECVQGYYSKMGLCDKKAYRITTNYLAKAEEYFISEYQKQINYDNKYCYKQFEDKECNKRYYNIDNKEDINNLVNYFDNFLIYLNNQVKSNIISDYIVDFNINIVFHGDSYQVLFLDIIKDNGLYHYSFASKDYDTGNNRLLDYINNYINTNHTFNY